jgi:parallel beta-helix repeat protein
MDQDRINGVGTTNFDISHNTITDLKKGAVPIAAYGPQSDAINVNGGNGGYGVISHNIIYNVDEGIDFFGQGINIVGNNIRLTSGAGIKSIHGAKRCNIANNIILDARGWGITVTSSVAGSVELNHFTGNFVEATGGTVNPFLTTTAALAIGETGGNVCTRNYFSGNTWYANGAMYLCKNNDILGGSTSENFSTSDEWRGPGTSGWFNSQNLLLICQSPIDPTVVKATLASNLTRNTSGEATVVWGAEVTDKRGEFNTGTGVWIAQLPGRYDVSVKMFTQALTAATNRLILSLKTNAGVDITQGIIQVPSTLPAQVKLVEFSVMVGSGLGLRTDLLLESTPGANVVFNATAAQTSFEIKTS